MKNYLCPCGGEIVFEKKKFFIIPDTKNGVCLNCKKQYKLVNGELIEKEETNGNNK